MCKAVLEVYPLERVDKFIQEVCWRTYWKGWLQMRPEVWQAYKAMRDENLNQLDKDRQLRARYNQALEGETGIDCFDAWVHELQTYGYLHNHARMWFASIWIFTLDLPWALGADFFLRHLLDGDAASNTLSWRWVAGLQTAGKNYVARASNIEKFTNGRFCPEGLASSPAPLDNHAVVIAPDNPFTGFDDQKPSADPDKTLFVIHEDDCGFRPEAIKHYVALDARAGLSPLILAPAKAAFTQAALGTEICLSTAQQIVDYAKQRGLTEIFMSRPCVGPVRDSLADLPQLAEREGMMLGVYTHEWDRIAWPKATKGFFQFRKSIPDLVALC